MLRNKLQTLYLRPEFLCNLTCFCKIFFYYIEYVFFFFYSFIPSVISTGLVKCLILIKNYPCIIMYNDHAEFLHINGQLKYCDTHSQPSDVIISVDIFVTVAEGSAGINCSGIFI